MSLGERPIFKQHTLLNHRHPINTSAFGHIASFHITLRTESFYGQGLEKCTHSEVEGQCDGTVLVLNVFIYVHIDCFLPVMTTEGIFSEGQTVKKHDWLEEKKHTQQTKRVYIPEREWSVCLGGGVTSIFNILCSHTQMHTPIRLTEP